MPIRYVKWGAGSPNLQGLYNKVTGNSYNYSIYSLQALLWLRTEQVENRADMPGLGGAGLIICSSEKLERLVVGVQIVVSIPRESISLRVLSHLVTSNTWED